MSIGWDKIGIFVAGMLFSTKGVELLKSDEARDIYVKTTAAGIRERDKVMTEVTALREECEDIYADALDYNEKRAAEKAVEKTAPKVIEDKAKATVKSSGSSKSTAKKPAAKKSASKK